MPRQSVLFPVGTDRPALRSWGSVVSAAHSSVSVTLSSLSCPLIHEQSKRLRSQVVTDLCRLSWFPLSLLCREARSLAAKTKRKK